MINSSPRNHYPPFSSYIEPEKAERTHGCGGSPGRFNLFLRLWRRSSLLDLKTISKRSIQVVLGNKRPILTRCARFYEDNFSCEGRIEISKYIYILLCDDDMAGISGIARLTIRGSLLSTQRIMLFTSVMTYSVRSAVSHSGNNTEKKNNRTNYPKNKKKNTSHDFL